MKTQDFRLGGVPGFDRHQLIGQTRHLQQVAEAALGLGVFGVGVGLYRVAVGHGPGVVASVVPHIQFVADEAGSDWRFTHGSTSRLRVLSCSGISQPAQG